MCVRDDNLLNTADLQIQMLGSFQVRHQEEILAWPTQKSKALLQILLVEPGYLVSTDQILEYLWPDLPPRKAQNNLWVTVSQLRRVLQPDLPPRALSTYIHKQDEGYRFNSKSDYCLDGETFATYLAIAQAESDLKARIEGWEAARVLYRGDYLEDEPYAEWAQIPRIQWRRRYEQLLINLAEAFGQNGRFQKAITHCRETLTLDNTNETAYRLLMRCYASLGERATALKVYDEAVQILQDEIGIDPTKETIELAQQIRLLEGNWKLDAEKRIFSNNESTISFPFVGRGKEINQLTQLISQTVAGQGQLVFISGEPGIGKSRLINETVILASQKKFHTLSANCYQVEQSMPYQPLIDLVRQVMTDDDHWQQLAPFWLRELTLLVPEMEETAIATIAVSPPADEPEESKQGRLFQAIFQLFANQAKRQKLLLIVEDIHWADPTTLQFLHYLARQIDQAPMVIILSFREESLSSNADLVTLTQNLQREEHVTSLALARLTEEDTTAYLGQTTDATLNADHLGHWLYLETDGNPFFLVSLLQSVREDGLLDNAQKTDWAALARTDPNLTLPDAIRNSVRNRLQRLPQREQEVLDWMAVYGRQLDFSKLQIISHQPQITLLNAIEQLVARQLLVERTGQYDFSHNKIREVVYYDLSAARCGLYHQQIAETLVASSPPPDEMALLAHHFERSGENERAIGYWMKAGKHALGTYAHEQAANHYGRVLALTVSPTIQMDAYLGLGNAFILLDDHKAATAVIQRGLDLVEDHGEDIRRVQLLYAQAQNANRQHRPDGGKPEVEAALVAAEQTGDEYFLAQSLLLLTEVHESNGDLSSALETATRAKGVSSKLNDDHLEARALVEIGFLHAQRAEFHEAVNAVELGLKFQAETGDRNLIAYAWNILGRALGGRGDYGRALDAFQRSQKEAKIIGDRYLLAQVFNMNGWLYRELGDYENALKFDKEGVNFAKQWGKPSPEISARLNICLDMLHLGDANQVLTLLDEIEEQISIGSFGFHNWRWQLRLMHTRGLCFLALDKPTKALALAEEGLPLAETNVTRKYIALNNDLKGKALAELGNVDEAIAAMKTAIFLADDIQYQPIRWGSRNHLAVLYQQTGRNKEAKKILAKAKQITHTIASALEDEKLRSIFLDSALSQ